MGTSLIFPMLGFTFYTNFNYYYFFHKFLYNIFVTLTNKFLFVLLPQQSMSPFPYIHFGLCLLTNISLFDLALDSKEDYIASFSIGLFKFFWLHYFIKSLSLIMQYGNVTSRKSYIIINKFFKIQFINSVTCFFGKKIYYY